MNGNDVYSIFVPAAIIEFGKNGLPHDYLTLPPKQQSSTRVRHDFTRAGVKKVIGTDFNTGPQLHDFEIL